MAVKASASCTIVVAAVTEVLHSEWVLSTKLEEQLADIAKVSETVVQAHDVMAMMADAEKKIDSLHRQVSDLEEELEALVACSSDRHCELKHIVNRLQYSSAKFRRS